MLHESQTLLLLLGTLYGGGYNCKTNETNKFEDEEVGIWNKVRQIFFENNTKYIQVPAWTNWILKMIKEKVNVEK